MSGLVHPIGFLSILTREQGRKRKGVDSPDCDALG